MSHSTSILNGPAFLSPRVKPRALISSGFTAPASLTTRPNEVASNLSSGIHTLPHDCLLWFRDNITNLHDDLLRAVITGLEGKPFEPPTIKERVEEARRTMLERLRQREMAC